MFQYKMLLHVLSLLFGCAQSCDANFFQSKVGNLHVNKDYLKRIEIYESKLSDPGDKTTQTEAHLKHFN